MAFESNEHLHPLMAPRRSAGKLHRTGPNPSAVKPQGALVARVEDNISAVEAGIQRHHLKFAGETIHNVKFQR
jgi:S1-C subfamily serine protease